MNIGVVFPRVEIGQDPLAVRDTVGLGSTSPEEHAKVLEPLEHEVLG